MVALAGAAIDSVCRQGSLNLLPEIVIDDRGVLAWIGLVLMHGLATIDAVLQHVVERAPGHGFDTIETAILCPAALADDACGIQVLLEEAHRTKFLIAA